MNIRFQGTLNAVTLYAAACLTITGCSTGLTPPSAQQAAGQAPTLSASYLVEAKTSCAKSVCIYVADPAYIPYAQKTSLSTSAQRLPTTPTDAINVYAGEASGNKAPVEYITGPATELDYPLGVAVDANHRIYAANINNSSITVYAAGANGNASPIRNISGSFTGLQRPVALTLSDEGTCYVVNTVGNNAPATITIYRAGSNGNVPPTRVISGSLTGLGSPGGIALDSSGRIYVTYGAVNGAIAVFAAKANGNVAPLARITGAGTGLVDPSGISVDADGNIYVANGGNGSGSTITVYAKGSNGAAAPIRVIAGGDTGLDGTVGLALDAKGNTYISNNGNASLAVYRAGSNGDVPPIRAIVGSNTLLDSPVGVAVR